MTVIWWIALALALYLGSGIAISTVKKQFKVASWAIVLFLIAVVTCLALLSSVLK